VNAGDISPLTPSGTPPLPPTAASNTTPRPQSAYTPPRPLSAYTPPGEKSYTPPPQDCFTPPLPPPPPPPAATATFESPTAKLTPPLPPGPPPPRRRFETESGEEGSLSGMELKENIFIYTYFYKFYIFAYTYNLSYCVIVRQCGVVCKKIFPTYKIRGYSRLFVFINEFQETLANFSQNYSFRSNFSQVSAMSATSGTFRRRASLPAVRPSIPRGNTRRCPLLQ
jgi:hypothetical protein